MLGKQKDAPASSSKKTTPPLKPQPKRSDTGSSSKSNTSLRDEHGKISPLKAAKSFFSSMPVTPSTRSASKKSSDQPEESSNVKETVRSASPQAILKVHIPIEIDSGILPANWIMYTVPFDRTCEKEMFSWAGSKSYNMDESEAEADDFHHERGMYLESLMPKDGQKQDLTVFLQFTQAMRQQADQAFADVKNVTPPMLYMAKHFNVRIDLLFDTKSDPRLARNDYRSMAANLVQAHIVMVQDEQERDRKRKIRSQVKEVKAEDHDLTMSGAVANDDPALDDATILVRDFVLAESGGQVRKTMFENSDAEFYEMQKLRGSPTTPVSEPPHYYKGDESDDAILPAPPKR